MSSRARSGSSSWARGGCRPGRPRPRSSPRRRPRTAAATGSSSGASWTPGRSAAACGSPTGASRPARSWSATSTCSGGRAGAASGSSSATATCEGASGFFYLSRVRGLRESKLPGDEAAARARRGKKGDYDVPDAFDVRAWSRQQIWDYDVHPPRPAAIRFRGSLARLAKQLLPAADVAIDAAGARVARLEVRNLRGLVRQALAWGPEAEIVEPAEARGIAREILDAIAPRSGSTP